MTSSPRSFDGMTSKEWPTGLARPPHADLFEREHIDRAAPRRRLSQAGVRA